MERAVYWGKRALIRQRPSTHARGEWVLQRGATRIRETDLIDQGRLPGAGEVGPESAGGAEGWKEAGNEELPAKGRTREGFAREGAGSCGLNWVSPHSPKYGEVVTPSTYECDLTWK